MNVLLAVISCLLVIIGWYEMVGGFQSPPDNHQSEDEDPLDTRADLIYSSYQNFMGGADKTLVSFPDKITDNSPNVHQRYARGVKHNGNKGSSSRRRKRKRSQIQRTRTTSVTQTTATEPPPTTMDNITEPECRPCVWRKQRKYVRMEMIKKEILRKLKMDEPPKNVSWRHKSIDLTNIPGTINPDNITHNDAPVPESEPEGDKTTIITFASEAPVSLNQSNEHVIYFDIRSDILNSELQKAELHIYVKPQDNPGTPVGHIAIYPITNSSHGKIDFENQPSKRYKVVLDREHTGVWHQINIKPLVHKWIASHGRNNYGMRITANNFLEQNPEPFAVISHQNSTYNPKLWVEIDTAKSSRQRRGGLFDSTQICEEFSKEESCCRYKLVVDFQDFGTDWDWILYPRSYNAYYCAGLCDFSELPNSKHAHIVSLWRGTEQAGGPCCTPIKSSPISLIYFDHHGRIVYATLEDMVADRCGCN